MLLLKYVFVLALFSKVISVPNSNLNNIFNKLKDIRNKNITWPILDESLQLVADSVLLPNIGALYELHKTLNISYDCYESLHSTIMGLRNRKRWAIEMVDASGKIPGGILEGTMMDFGSLDECLKIRVDETSKFGGTKELFRGRYCMVGYQSPLISPMSQKTKDGKKYVDVYGTPPEWARDGIEKAAGYLKRVAFWFGTCVPSTCTKEDIRKIALLVSSPLGFNVTVRDCQVDEPYVWPSYSVAAVSVLCCLAALCTLGTLVDIISRWRRSNPSNSEDDHVFLRIPKAFSFLANTENLFGSNIGNGNLACFNGIRFLSATWIVLGHTYFFTDTWKYLKYRRLLGFVDQFSRHLPVAVIENFTVPVGSFFFMSGFLLVYTTWNALEKSEGKFNLPLFIIHKFWRMTPSLGFTLAVFFCMPLIDSGPLWNSTLNPALQQCQEFWWTNFLYINNWWNSDQFCLLHTWYLAALMQFHITGVILLVITYRRPVIGILLGSILTTVCTAITALLIIQHDYPMPAPGIIKDMDIIEDYNSRIYVKPYAHFVTYQVGMVTAYIVLKYHRRKISPKYQVVGWMLAVIGALSSVYGLYGPASNIAVRVLYIIGHRIGWALSIGWMVYACALGNGGIVNRLLSWSAMGPLGQLSYLTYLIHPLVIIYRNASLRERVYYGHTELVFSFLSNLVVSLFLAFAGYVTVETPFAILEKIIFRNKSKMHKKMEYKEESQITPPVTKELDP